MEVTFQLDREDFWRFNINRNGHQSAIPSVGAGVVALLVLRLCGVSWPGSFVASIGVFGVAIPLFNRRIRRFYLSVPKSQYGFLAKQTIAISPEGVRVKTPASESMTTWKGIWAVQDDERYIYLFTDSFMAYLVPKQAFLSRDSSFQFVSACRRFRKASTDGNQGVDASDH